MRVKLDNDMDTIHRILGKPEDEDFVFDTEMNGSLQKICLTVTTERGDDEWNRELYTWIQDKVYDLHSELIGKLTERTTEIYKAGIKEQRLDSSRLP